MEIRYVLKESQNKYPKINEVNTKKITKQIPDCWRKFGVSLIMFEMLGKSKVLASVPINSQIVGGLSYNYTYHPIEMIHGIVYWLTIIAGIICIIGGGYFKLKEKREEKKFKATKIFKIILIATVSAYIITLLLYYFIPEITVSGTY